MYSIKTITEPATEPVTVDELKAHLRLNTTDEDTLLSSFISTARQQFEHLTQCPVIAQTLIQYVDSIPSISSYPTWANPGYYGGYAIRLMRANVSSITSVKYYNGTDTETTDTTYTFNSRSTPARIEWTTPLSLSARVKPIASVTFVAGFTTVPADVQTAIKLLAANYYEYRTADVTDSLKELPYGFAAVCAKYNLSIRGTWGM